MFQINNKLKLLIKNRHYSLNFLKEFEYLLNCGAQPNKIPGLMSELINKRDIKVIKLLLNYGYNPNKFNNCYPFIEAIRSNNTKLVELLYNYGANINLKDFNGNTGLHTAVKLGNDQIIINLIRYNCNLSETNYKGETPLHIACINEDLDTIKTLLKFTDPNKSTIIRSRTRNKIVVNVVKDVFINGSVEIFKLLLPKTTLEVLYPLTKYSYSTSSSSLNNSISPSQLKNKLVWSRINNIKFLILQLFQIYVQLDSQWFVEYVITFLI